MLACFPCENLSKFVQVSERADARELTMTLEGLRREGWNKADTRDPGVYCAVCGRALTFDVIANGLVDDRIDYLKPDAFDASAVADELRGLRPDAAWNVLDVPARAASFGELASDVHPSVIEALRRTGRATLYRHQAQAVDAALRGENVVQATSAGSGKSLGFTLPVLDRLIRDPAATAVVMFPLLALANDQLNALARLGTADDPWVDDSALDLTLGEGIEPIRVARLDGSTPAYAKKAIRDHARLLITTPDQVHLSVLRMAVRKYADGSSWRRLLGGLSVVVLDEIHTYQGVFGSNVAQVLRRLRRASAAHGASPQFLTASATIGNPVDLAERLTGTGPFTLVDQDGSPVRPRKILICNPPPLAEQASKTKPKHVADEAGRVAPQTVAIELIPSGALASTEHAPVRTICFARSRHEVFQLAQRLKAALTSLHRPELADAVAPYAATFTSEARQDQESKIRDGSTLAVVSTNALELGIDIPSLSLAVLIGYPGQLSSFRQRAGRVGRAGEGLVVLIVGDDPLQQYLAQRPEELARLLEARAEDVVVNPEAREVLRRYGIQAAAADLGGLAFEDAEYFGKEAVESYLADAVGPPKASYRGRDYWFLGDTDEDAYENLRSPGGADSYTVQAVQGQKKTAIGTIDGATAPRDAFQSAVWTTPDGTYEITGFSTKTHEVFARGPLALPYSTRGMAQDTVTLLDVVASPAEVSGAAMAYGALSIARSVHSFKKITLAGTETTEQVPSGGKWPPVEFLTEGLALSIPAEWLAGGAWDADGALRALEHVLLALSPRVVACDPIDLDANTQHNTLYLYDSFGGGIGISRPAFERFDEIVDLGVRVVGGCPCETGCPGCVHSARRPDGNRGLSKEGGLDLLGRLAGSSARI